MIPRFVILLLFIIGNRYQLYAQCNTSATDAAMFAMAQTSAMQSGSRTIGQNPAGIATTKTPIVGCIYNNLFGIKELSYESVYGILPSHSGTFALSYNHFGYNVFSTDCYSLSYSNVLIKDKLSAGIQLDYLRIRFADPEYGAAGVPYCQLGIISHPIRGLDIGLHVYNPTSASFPSVEMQQLPVMARLGAGYNFVGNVYFCAQIDKTIKDKPIFRTALEYSILKKIFLRAGISSYPVENTFGVGYLFEHWIIDFGLKINPILGYSSALSFSYRFSKK